MSTLQTQKIKIIKNKIIKIFLKILIRTSINLNKYAWLRKGFVKKTIRFISRCWEKFYHKKKSKFFQELCQVK